MRKEPKEHLDRDSLLLFRTLCATHNLQRAASQLGMPQATASCSLTKLREAFEDELFTRCSGGLVRRGPFWGPRSPWTALGLS